MPSTTSALRALDAPTCGRLAYTVRGSCAAAGAFPAASSAESATATTPRRAVVPRSGRERLELLIDGRHYRSARHDCRVEGSADRAARSASKPDRVEVALANL